MHINNLMQTYSAIDCYCGSIGKRVSWGNWKHLQLKTHTAALNSTCKPSCINNRKASLKAVVRWISLQLLSDLKDQSKESHDSRLCLRWPEYGKCQKSTSEIRGRTLFTKRRQRKKALWCGCSVVSALSLKRPLRCRLDLCIKGCSVGWKGWCRLILPVVSTPTRLLHLSVISVLAGLSLSQLVVIPAQSPKNPG